MLKSAVCLFVSRRNNSFLKLISREYSRMANERLDGVPTVDIENGTFKYVLMKVYDTNDDGNEICKNIVRGYKDCEWHSDIYERASFSCQALGLDTECLGGGKIQHIPSNKLIKIYGVSQGYGKADHDETKRILQEKYVDYEVQVSP